LPGARGPQGPPGDAGIPGITEEKITPRLNRLCFSYFLNTLANNANHVKEMFFWFPAQVHQDSKAHQV